MVDPETGRRAARPARGRARSSTPPRSSARSPRPTRTGRSSRSSSSTPTSTRQQYGRFPKTLIFAANDLPHTSHADQLVDLARDVFGRGDAFVQKITGRVDRPLQRIREFRNRPEARHRRHGRPADHRRRHPRPGVHRLPAAGEVAHPLRADARPRHPQGRAVPRQVALHGLRLLRRHAARVLPQRDRRSPPSRPSSRRARIARDHRGHLAEPGPRLQRPLPRQAPAAHRQGDVAARPASCSPRFIPDGDLGALRRASCPARSRRDFTGDDEAPARRRRSRTCSSNYPRPPRTFLVRRRARGHGHVRVADPRRRRHGVQARGLPRARSPSSSARTPTRSRRSASCSTGRRTGAPTPLTRAAAEAGRSAAALHRGRTCRRPTSSRYHKALVDIISMVKHAADEAAAAADRRGARRAAPSRR